MIKDFGNLKLVEIEIFNYCNRTCEFCPNATVDRKMFGDSIEEEEWIKLFNILKHNYLHLPVHAENQKQKVIDKINDFMGETK